MRLIASLALLILFVGIGCVTETQRAFDPFSEESSSAKILKLFEPYNEIAKGFTTECPDLDSVEIHLIEQVENPIGSFSIYDIKETESPVSKKVTLEGEDALRFSKLWRSLEYNKGYSALCHTPAFGLVLKSKSEQVLKCTLCFECSNFYFVKPDVEMRSHGFNPDNPQADVLLSWMQELLHAE